MEGRGASWHTNRRRGRGRDDQKSNKDHHSKGLADHGDPPWRLVVRGPCQTRDFGIPDTK
jgi:hypothetical protein